MGACCEPKESTFFIITDDDIHKSIQEDPNHFDNLRKNESSQSQIDHYPSSTSTVINDNFEINQMEDELFNLINSLRQYPQRFIDLIEKYKNSMLYDSNAGNYFIIINGKIY